MLSRLYPLIFCHWGVTVIAFGSVAYLKEGWLFGNEVFQQDFSGGIHWVWWELEAKNRGVSKLVNLAHEGKDHGVGHNGEG